MLDLIIRNYVMRESNFILNMFVLAKKKKLKQSEIPKNDIRR